MTEASSGKTTSGRPASRRIYRGWAVWLARFIVGGVFLFSGFVKAIDPWGFLFKIEDYLAVWGMQVPRTIVLAGAAAICAFEFVAGFMVLVGALKRFAPLMLLLSMVVMLPLTFYTWVADPVADCGCFGEALVISNAATFWKNVILTLLIIYLCLCNKRLRRCVYRPALQWLVLVISFCYIMAVALYGYHIQPMLDFRPYPVGTPLATLIDEGDPEIRFVYEQAGVRDTFPMDSLPDEGDGWQYVDRIETERERTAEPLAIYDGVYDVSDEVLSPEGLQMVLVIPEPKRTDISYTYAINEMQKAAEREGGSMVGLLASTPSGIRKWTDLSMAAYPCYSVEDTQLKQLARGEMAMVCLQDGKVVWKRSLAAFDFDTVDDLGRGDIGIRDLEIDDTAVLTTLTIGTGVLLLFIALFQEFIITLWRKTKKIANFAAAKRKGHGLTEMPQNAETLEGKDIGNNIKS